MTYELTISKIVFGLLLFGLVYFTYDVYSREVSREEGWLVRK